VVGEPPARLEGLRYHAMLAITRRCVLVTGGCNFRSFRKNTNTSMLVCISRGWESCWYKLEGGDGGARSGHGAALLGQEVYLVGGQQLEERIVPNIARLQFCCQEET